MTSIHIFAEPKHFHVYYEGHKGNKNEPGRFAFLPPDGYKLKHQMWALTAQQFLLLIDNLPHAFRKLRSLTSEDLDKEGTTIWSVSLTEHYRHWPWESETEILLELIIEKGEGQVYIKDLESDDEEPEEGEHPQDMARIVQEDIEALNTIFEESLLNWYRESLCHYPPHPRVHWIDNIEHCNCKSCTTNPFKFEHNQCDCLHCELYSPKKE